MAIAFWLTPPTTRRTILAAAVLFLAYLLAGLQSSQLDVPWKVDEGQRITEGYFWRLLARGDVTNPDWFRAATIRSHPPVPKYVFGASVALAGLEPPRDLSLANAYGEGAGASTMPDAFVREYLPMRWPARVASLIFNLVTAVAVFAVLLRAQGLAVAILSQILLFRHYLFVLALFYARSDTIQTCLTLCTIVPLLICGSSSRLTRALLAALAAGTLSALAFQTRLNGGVALIMCVAFLIAHAPRRKRTLLFIAAVVVAFVVVSVVVNPFYWATPRAADSEIEPAYYEPEALPLRVAHRFILQVKDLVVLSNGVPEEWHLRSRGARLLFTASVLGSGKAGILTAFGFLLVLSAAVRRTARPEERAVAAWAAAGLLVMAFWIPLRWDIYLLIVVPSTILAACVGFGILLRRLAQFPLDNPRSLHGSSMSLRTRIGALLRDWPRFELALQGWGSYRHLETPWIAVRNRDETLTFDGRGARCEWRFTSDLHIGKVFPGTAGRLMRRALSDWPIVLQDAPGTAERPDVSFVIGHRGLSRLPHLLATLRTIAGQRDAAVECIVVEQSSEREIESLLPGWVRYIHTPLPSSDYAYNRSWALNVGARQARGTALVLHDNDMLCPAGYAAESLKLVRAQSSFLELKRFLFYLSEADTLAFLSTGNLATRACTVVQNAQGGSVAVSREAFVDIGGYDESFVGWGGEDNEFWERAEARGHVYTFGYLPFVHLWHAPQGGKTDRSAAPGVQRYYALATVPPESRIERLRAMEWGSPSKPAEQPE